MGWSAVCTSAHVQMFCTLCSFAAPTCKTICTTSPKLAGHTYTALICTLFWLSFSWDAGCTRQDRNKLFERVPAVLGNFELATPNLAHCWSSMCVIRWCIALMISCIVHVHSTCTMHIAHAYCIGIFTSGNFEGVTRKLVHWYSSTSALRWCMTWNAVGTLFTCMPQSLWSGKVHKA